MPRLAGAIPKYRKHKASGQAFVELNGRRHYLGPYGVRVSYQVYDRLISEWLQNGRLGKSTETGGLLLVLELIVAYLKFASGYYRKDGKLTSEYAAIVHAVLPLQQLYGTATVTEFGPIALQTVMTKMVELGWARTTVNRNAGRIKRMFKWGVSRELLPPAIYQGLSTVGGLRKGRTDARETQPVLPVPDETVERTLTHLPDVVADMVRIQRWTGCRPSEICYMRPCDIDRNHQNWMYRPISHKTEHHNRERIVFIGPKAQKLLLKYLDRLPAEHCFQPTESEIKRRAAAHAVRRTPINQGNRPGSSRKHMSRRPPGKQYSVASYRRAISRACDLAFPHPQLSGLAKAKQSDEQQETLNKWRIAHRWSPNQLRHTAATEVRKRFGLEAAQVYLGHSKADVTQIYAERDLTKAIEVATAVG